MLPQKQAEEAIVNQSSDHDDREEEIPDHHQTGFSLSNFLWHGGSVYDAWFSCASNQVSNFTKNPTHSFCFFECHFWFWELGIDCFCRLLKFCWHCHTLSLNWVCFQASYSKSFMAFWEAGLLISSVFSTLSTEAERRKKTSTSRTMSFRLVFFQY